MQRQEVDSTILVGPFHLKTLYDTKTVLPSEHSGGRAVRKGCSRSSHGLPDTGGRVLLITLTADRQSRSITVQWQFYCRY